MRMHNDSQPKPQRNSDCVCGKPMSISIPAGEHIHPCPVHTDVAVYGRDWKM